MSAAETISSPLGAVPADGEWIRSFAGRLAVRIPGPDFRRSPARCGKAARPARGRARAHTGGIGSVLLAQQAGMTVSGGAGLNIANTRSLDELPETRPRAGRSLRRTDLAQARSVAPVIPRGVTATAICPS